MFNYEKDIVPHIEAIYSTFSPAEKTIADFFINNQEQMDFSSKAIADKLFISPPSLSRFAKKCGYSGYREFLFHYQEGLSAKKTAPVTDKVSRQVLNTYQTLLNKSYALIDDEQMNRLCAIFSEKKRIFVYGKGSSGLAGQEMKFRFMRIGVDIEAITDDHVMKMNSVLLNDSCACIGISISGQTPEVIEALKTAHASGSSVILFTSHIGYGQTAYCDEIVPLALQESIEYGNTISPQFPILVIIDMLFAHFLQYDTHKKEGLYNYTIDIIKNIGESG